MSDRLYFSCWVQGFNESNLLRHYAKLLDIFPTSKLSTRPRILRVWAVDATEPPALERSFDAQAATGEILAAAREFTGPDCAIELETAWDLWQFDGDWKLAPAPVTLSVLGPRFEADAGDRLQDHLRIDFGLDTHFLPAPEIAGSLRMQQSNLRSLLRLLEEAGRALPLSQRQLWSESGANFAELLKKAVGEFPVH
jgi:hypothetical protein